MSGYKYVPDGVFLACSQGTETSNLKITYVKDTHLYSNQKYATNRDVNPENIGSFGNCREINTKCKYRTGKWKNVHPTLSVEGASPLLDKMSKLECPYKGEITIHFDKASAETVSGSNANKEDGINWGRIGTHLSEKGEGILQGMLLGSAIIGGCAIVGGLAGAFAGGAGAVPGAIAGAKVGTAIVTALGAVSAVESAFNTYKSGERIFESYNKIEDGIIFATDLTETTAMIAGLKSGIKNFDSGTLKVGKFVGSKINSLLKINTVGPFGGNINIIVETGKLENGTEYAVMEDVKGKLKNTGELFTSEGRINSEGIARTNNMNTGELYQWYKGEGKDVGKLSAGKSKRGLKFTVNGDRNINSVRSSTGGGTHGESPYRVFGTTGNGKIKVVKGGVSQYGIRGKTPERSTLVFSNEMGKISGKWVLPIMSTENRNDKEEE